MAASVRMLRLRVVVVFIWFVVGVFLLSNYAWGHYPPPTCEHPGQFPLKYLSCPDRDGASGTGARVSDPYGLTPTASQRGDPSR